MLIAGASASSSRESRNAAIRRPADHANGVGISAAEAKQESQTAGRAVVSSTVKGVVVWSIEIRGGS